MESAIRGALMTSAIGWVGGLETTEGRPDSGLVAARTPPVISNAKAAVSAVAAAS